MLQVNENFNEFSAKCKNKCVRCIEVNCPRLIRWSENKDCPEIDTNKDFGATFCSSTQVKSDFAHITNRIEKIEKYLQDNPFIYDKNNLIYLTYLNKK